MLEQHYGKFIATSRRKLIQKTGFKLGLHPSTVAVQKERKQPS
jgi:hypothetical protein